MKKTLWIIILGLLTAGAIAMSWIAPFYLVWSIIFTVATAGCYIFYLVVEILNHKSRKLAFFALCLVLVIVALFVIFYYTGLLTHFSSLESARKWFESFGIWAWIMFFIIQLLQVVILPIPAQITTVAGVIIFGPWIAFAISSVATILGSLICFGIGKIFGVKVTYKLASAETIDKYRNLLTKKGRILLPVMFLFPAFPDDLLCFIAGTTNMTWKYFSIVTFSTRLVGIACICWFGSGDLIPFSGWGIPVWIVIGILMLTILIVLFKYQEKVEEWIIKTFTKKGKQKAKQKQIDSLLEPDSNKEEYVNFEDASKTQNDYINFENINSSNGLSSQTKNNAEKNKEE